MPPEVFERITEEVDANDLLPLRLASRETAQKSFRTFLKAHFTKGAFLLSSEKSLRTLLAIAENEPFARSMKMIDLSTEELVCDDDEENIIDYHLRRRRMSLEERLRRKHQDENWEVILGEQKRF
jgi:hypothetical protein